MVHKSRLLLYAVMVLVIQSGIASATTITVNDNGEGDYTSIQEAIDVANSGDTILVQNGTYYEHLLLIREDNLTLLGENKETTIIDGSGIGGIIKLISVDNSTIQGFTVQNGTKPSITEGFPTIMGYTQEFLKENYSLTILEVDVDGKKAWISLSKSGNEVDNEVIQIGEIYNYGASLSFNLDEIFLGNSINFIEISNVNQFSDDNSTKIVDNESALLVQGLSGRFIPTGGGISRELEENYSLNVIDIQTVGDQRKTMLFLLKNNSVIDYDIINVSENYTYYKNGNLTLEADIEAVFSGEGGIYLVKLSHVHQYSENNSADILLSDAVYLYFVGNARETEWILEQNYILTAMDIDIEDKYPMAPPPITPGSQQFIEATMDINTNNYIPQLWLRLMKDGATIEDQFVCPGDNITFYDGSKILDLTVGIIFDGRDADLATISNISQYNETDENDRLIQNESHMYIFEYPERDTRELDENYSITFMDIDSSTYSNPLVWVRMEKNGMLVDDQIIAQNEVYQFYNNSIKIFNASIDTIFSGRYLDLLILTNITQYCEENGTQLLVNANWSIYSDNTELIENLNDNSILYENYTIIPVDIDVDGTKVWMRLYKNNTMVDEIILQQGEDYSYYLDSEEIISTTLETVFYGKYSELIKLVDIYQYSEENGTLILYKNTELLELQHFRFNNDEGIHIGTSSSNIICNNNLQDVGRGISLVFSINNTLINNNITDNNYGIHLEDYSNYNSITDNNVINNSEGIKLQNSNYNHIYINNFINNSDNGYSYVSTNLWNSSDPIYYQYNDSTFINYMGNYWSDYTGSDADYDGIGDTPYNISAGVWDIYPLIEPWAQPVDTTPPIYYSGNRIWDEDADMSDTYTWTPKSFSGFYYDLDNDIGGETLTIENIDRSLGRGDIIYETSPISIDFEQDIWKTYEVISFMADRYFAGYTDDTNFASSSDSLLDERQLSKVLMDTDKKYNLSLGTSMELEEGYEFRIAEFGSGGDAVMVALFKNDEKVTEDIVQQDDTFVYEKNMGGTKDMPIIAVYFDSVYVGTETSTVVIEGIFQISDKYIDVSAGDEFGLMEIKSVYSSGIAMKNDNSVSLGLGDDFNLMGKINIIVADSSTLRFAPYVDISKPGTYELRGMVTEEIEFKWTPFNFEGLLYDIDTGEGDEILHIKRDSSGDRSIGENNLLYTTSPISKNFEHNSDGWNTFQSIGFMGKTYFAGYLKESSFISSDWSLINKGKLSRILIDDDKNHTIHIGNSLTLEQGYSLRIDAISSEGDVVTLSLLKDGDNISTDIASEGDTYIYEIDVDGTDIPIIVAHIDKVHSDMETNSSLIDGLFQISDNFTTLKNGDTYGIMEVTSFSSSSIVLKNEDSFNLSKGDTINIMGDIKFKVADDGSAIRFYPFQEVIEVLPTAIITQPEDGAYINGTINIIGTANDTNFKNYTLERKNTSSAWIEIRNSTQPVSDGTLAIWNTTNLEDDDYMIRLTVADNTFNSNITLINVTIDNTQPEVNITEPGNGSNLKFFENMVRGEVRDNNLNSAQLKVKNEKGETVNSYNLNITDGEFSKRVEFAPDQFNTLELVAVDKAEKSNSTNITVFVGNNSLINQTDVTKGVPVTIDAQNEINTTIEFISNVNTSNVTFTVTAITNETQINNLSNSVFAVYGEMTLGKIVEINVTGLDATNKSEVLSVTLNLYYTISDLDLDGDGTIKAGELDEENLYIYWYNDTSQNWTKLLKDNPDWVIDNGQLKISGANPGYVWAKVNHLSMFALVALPVPEPTEDGNGDGSGGGSSGGGGGSSGEDFYNIVLSETDRQSVFKNSSVSFIFDLEGNIVKHINFTALNSAGTVAAKVEILNHTSSLVSAPPPDEVFKNLNIWVGNYGWATEKNVFGTTVSFIVEKSWVTDNDIDETTIALYHYSDNNWNKLVTRKIAEDANSLQFEAETPGFSPFAVTGKKIMGETGDEVIIAEPTITAEKTSAPTPTEKTGIPGFSQFVCLSVLLIAMRRLHKKN